MDEYNIDDYEPTIGIVVNENDEITNLSAPSEIVVSIDQIIDLQEKFPDSVYWKVTAMFTMADGEIVGIDYDFCGQNEDAGELSLKSTNGQSISKQVQR